MAHPRADIRNKVVALLSGATAAQTRVLATRVGVWRKVELPAIAVWDDNESVDSETGQSAPRELRRTFSLVVEAAVGFSDAVEDDMDAIALEIERVFNVHRYLDGTAGETLLTATEKDVALDGERPIGVVQLHYEITYRTEAIDEDAVLDNFAEAGITYDLGGVVHASGQAQDKIALEVAP